MNDALRGLGPTPAPRDIGAAGRPPAPPRPRGGGFAELVSRELQSPGGIKLSAHAQARLEQRALDLSASGAARLRQAVDAAAAKGARQSLVLLDDLALIVNIPSRTVVTAIGSDGARGTVFTNIDSAVVAPGGDARADSQSPMELDLPRGSSGVTLRSGEDPSLGSTSR